MNWFDQSTWTNSWGEQQKNFFQAWSPGKGLSMPGVDAAAAASAHDGMAKMNDLVRRSMEGWATLAQVAPAQAGAPLKGHIPAFDPATLARLIDPREWSRALASGVDTSLERMIEGPTYATPTDIDRKIRKAHQLWLQRALHIEGYHQQVQAAWSRAFDKMLKALNDAEGAPLKGARAVLNLWLEIANEALLEMHHRPDFLEAQRKMTRAAAEYRLAEQELAEVFCAIHHIPTRSEMDEAQKSLVELRREVRALKRRLDREEPRGAQR